MKTKEELNQIKEDIANLTNKVSELSEEELMAITGGSDFWDIIKKIGKGIHSETKPVVK